jgi:hypothetical protein
VRVLTAALIVAVLLLVSFAASAQEQLRLYTVEEGVLVACKGNQLMTQEERKSYDEDMRKIGGDPHRIVRSGIFMSLARVTGPFPKVSELRFSDKVHPIAKTLVEETFWGFKFDPTGHPLVIEEACGFPTPTHATTPKLIIDRLGLELKAENLVALVKGTSENSSVLSRGILLVTAGYIGPFAMRWPTSIRTAALDVRMTLEAGRTGLCYEIVSSPLDAQWLWRRIIPDTASLKIVDCALARQAPSQPSQPSTPDR